MRLQRQAVRLTWLGLVCASLVAACTDAADAPTAVNRAPGEPSFHLAHFVVPQFQGKASVLDATLLGGAQELHFPNPDQDEKVFIDQDSNPREDEYTFQSVPLPGDGKLNLLRAATEFENKQISSTAKVSNVNLSIPLTLPNGLKDKLSLHAGVIRSSARAYCERCRERVRANGWSAIDNLTVNIAGIEQTHRATGEPNQVIRLVADVAGTRVEIGKLVLNKQSRKIVIGQATKKVTALHLTIFEQTVAGQVIPGSEVEIATSEAQITCDFEDH